MLHQRHFDAASRRFRAASTELQDPAVAAEATLRMAYLWVWGSGLDHPLGFDDLRDAIYSFQVEYRNGPARRQRPGDRQSRETS